MEPRPSGVAVVAHQIEEHGLVAGPDLPQEQGVEDLGRFDQLGEGLALVRRQRRGVGRNVHRRETAGHSFDARLVGCGGVLLSLLHGWLLVLLAAASGDAEDDDDDDQVFHKR
ncbi:hypothetical protein D3C83_39530 [compost metagenome]